jgi:tRNA(fMet)-specific endonuclease VapC
MSSVILDTNIVSYVMKKDTRADLYRPHMEGRTLAISFMTVAELYEGAYRDKWGQRKMNLLEDQLKNFVVVPFSRSICLEWGKLRAARRNQPIDVADGWIAATALVHGCPLVTHNPDHFGSIAGLEIITGRP